ncbi:MAG: hypothetical protein JEZ11_27565 [Desulfobacterales bacterium]|nr:hypothetical protein [Desulfobacterales bacterium]
MRIYLFLPVLTPFTGRVLVELIERTIRKKGQTLKLEKIGETLILTIGARDLLNDARFKGLHACDLPQLFIIQNQVENNKLLLPCFHLSQMGFIDTARIYWKWDHLKDEFTFSQEQTLRGMGRGVQATDDLRQNKEIQDVIKSRFS